MIRTSLTLAALTATLAWPLAAQPLPPAPEAGAGLSIAHLVQATILPGWRTEGGTRMVALHLRLAEGWKTYWRLPGEAGIAPRFDWSASQNLRAVQVHWPRPEVFDQGGFSSIGYHDELVLPLELTAERGGVPIVLDGALSIGVCDDICVPADLRVQAVLRGAGAPDPRIARALDDRAQPAGRAGLTALRCALEPAERGVRLTLTATLPRQGGAEAMVIELPDTGLWVTDTRTRRDGPDLIAQATVRGPQGAAVAVQRADVGVTFLGGDTMLEHRGCTAD
jgi:DsbC/DsbD-like thiol-disulfide interchange protein